MFGDLGLTVDEFRDLAPSIPALINDLQAPVGPGYDGVILAGDWAYDFADQDGRVGDAFMNAIQPFAGRKPLMGAIGNHECGGTNRQHYAMRLGGLANAARNSGGGQGGIFPEGDALWYSFDAGLVHFVALDTAGPWFDKLGMQANFTVGQDGGEVFLNGLDGCAWNPTTRRLYRDEMMAWLEADLAAVDRSKTPWVVGYGHTAWYMQGYANWSAIDDIANRHGMDLWFGAHVHSYQRFFPLRNAPCTNWSTPPSQPAAVDFGCAETHEYDDFSKGIGNNTYRNPKWMVSIVGGNPGNDELTNQYPNEGMGNQGWTSSCGKAVQDASISNPMAMCHGNYGYGKLQAVNKTHLHWTWSYTGFGTPQCPDNVYKMPGKCQPPDTSSWPPTAFKDELWLIQEKHGRRNDYHAPPAEGESPRPEGGRGPSPEMRWFAQQADDEVQEQLHQAELLQQQLQQLAKSSACPRLKTNDHVVLPHAMRHGSVLLTAETPGGPPPPPPRWVRPCMFGANCSNPTMLPPAPPEPPAAPAPWPPQKGGAACTGVLDCQLNGRCVNSRCQCNAAWTGANCSYLHQMPATRGEGFSDAQATTSSWGNAVRHDPISGKWFMMADEMANHCGMLGWEHASRCVIAQADNASGPYTRVAVMQESWCHGSFLERDPISGRWLSHGGWQFKVVLELHQRHHANGTVVGALRDQRIIRWLRRG